MTLQKAALQDDVIPHPNSYLWNAPQIVENQEISRDGSQGRSIVKCLSVYIHFPQPRPMFSSKAAQLFPYIQIATHFTHARMEGRGRLFHKLKLAFLCNTRGHNKVRQSSGSSPSDTEIHIPLKGASASCTPRPRRYWHTITITSTDFSLRKRRILKTEMLRVLMGMMSCIPGVCRSVHAHVHRGQRLAARVLSSLRTLLTEARFL